MNTKNIFIAAACLFASYEAIRERAFAFDCKGYVLFANQTINPATDFCTTFNNTGSRLVATFTDHKKQNTTTVYGTSIFRFNERFENNPDVDRELCFVSNQLRSCKQREKNKDPKEAFNYLEDYYGKGETKKKIKRFLRGRPTDKSQYSQSPADNTPLSRAKAFNQ